MNSAANPETLADIAREREMSKGLSKKLDKNQAIPGNVAAMRAALLNARTRFASLALTESEWRTCAESHVREIDAALAAPARNCDVWSSDEQAERFDAECKRHEHCTSCPVHAMWGVFRAGQPKSCKFIWAQMPYEEGGAE